MLGLLIGAVIIGVLAAVVSGIGWLFFAVAGGIFFCGLPAALGTGFVHDEVSYAADRADARQEEADQKADMRELVRDVTRDGTPSVVYDNRQVHFHGGGK
jgi:hypothetical protein